MADSGEPAGAEARGGASRCGTGDHLPERIIDQRRDRQQGRERRRLPPPGPASAIMDRALSRGGAADRRRHRGRLLHRHHRDRPLPGPEGPEPGGLRPRGPPRALVGGDGLDHRGGDERGDLPGRARRGLHHAELRLRADHDRADPGARRGRPRLPAAVLHLQGLHGLRLPRGALRTVEQGLRLRPSSSSCARSPPARGSSSPRW